MCLHIIFGFCYAYISKTSDSPLLDSFWREYSRLFFYCFKPAAETEHWWCKNIKVTRFGVCLQMAKAGALLGMSTSYIVPVKNYSSELDLDMSTDILLLSAVDHILQYADLYFQDNTPQFDECAWIISWNAMSTAQEQALVCRNWTFLISLTPSGNVNAIHSGFHKFFKKHLYLKHAKSYFFMFFLLNFNGQNYKIFMGKKSLSLSYFTVIF